MAMLLSPRRKSLCLGITTLVFLGASVSGTKATIITLDLGNAPHITSELRVSFDGLNGTALAGQTVSLDLMFANAHFARLFTATSSTFLSLLELQTEGSGDMDFLHGTGYLLGENGDALQNAQRLGSAASDGFMSAGLSPLLTGELTKPLDFFGIHLDLTFPNDPHFTVSGGEFLLLAGGSGRGDVFGIGPDLPVDIVPEAGGTLLLLAFGFAAVIAVRTA